MTIPDIAARRAALTDFTQNLLVEAAAGTGKTSLMAGRVALMLAEGVDPSTIAAITFTELAASELEGKIRWTVGELRSGRLPPALTNVVAVPLAAYQLQNLNMAGARIDELTTTTIHGFCQTIIQSHGIDAALDPGARVVDEGIANALFDDVVSAWLYERLDREDSVDDPIAVLSKDDPLAIVQYVRELANLRRAHLDARALPPMDAVRLDVEFAEAVNEFERWYARSPGDEWTADLIEDLQRLATFFAGSSPAGNSFAQLWRYAHPPRIDIMKKRQADLLPYQRLSAWRAAHGADSGDRLGREATAHFDRVAMLYRNLMGRIAQSLIAEFSAALDGILTTYAQRKRESAVLDFDDLLRLARTLVCENEAIRQSLASRYLHLLVDEFQDTDKLQAEIIFSLSAIDAPGHWTEAILRAGALFLVGDPKQAIYRFRGADVEAYRLAKSVISREGNGEVLEVTANFRSREEILRHVNAAFEPVLNGRDQPGFVAIEPTLKLAPLHVPPAARITVEVSREAKAEEQRETEAAAVARLCKRLIGALSIADGAGTRLLRAGDIALLAPTSTDLWRYERALEAEKVFVASQAGQALFRRQEMQDVVALVRSLADPFDTLAFGALMRGPFVGLSDEDLLDITAALPVEGQASPRFTIRTPVEQVTNALARQILEQLQSLIKLVPETTPAQLLSFAIERLNLRVVLAARHGNRNARALANLDAALDLARPYAVQGLRAFALDLHRGWETKRRKAEGRVDSSEDAVELVTMHSAKGLEWPVVIPINSSTKFKPDDQFVHRQSDESLHWIIGGIEPPDLAAARRDEAAREARQRERLWYVAATRAKDLLVLPFLPGAHELSWSRVVDLKQRDLPEIDLSTLPEPIITAAERPTNEQSEASFSSEREQVERSSPPMTWLNPSDHDSDRLTKLGETFVVGEASEGLAAVIGAGAVRGSVLHKLMEEFLTGELPANEDAASARASQLLADLESLLPDSDRVSPEPPELAATAIRTWRMPDLQPYIRDLVPEYSLWSASPSGFLAGRADAVASEGERFALVVDWKSDVDPSPSTQATHHNQLSDYLSVTGAARGALVYMSLGSVVWIDNPDAPRS